MRKLRRTYADRNIENRVVQLQQDIVKYKTNQLYGTSQIKATYIGNQKNTPYHYYTQDEWHLGYRVIKGIYHITGSYPNRPIQAHIIVSDVPGFHTPDGLGAVSSIEYVGDITDPMKIDVYFTYRIFDSEYSGGDFVANIELYANMSASWKWEDLGWQLAP